jgi:hypothetical protein
MSYNLSTDYDKLYDVVTSGTHRVLGFCRYKESLLRDPVIIDTRSKDRDLTKGLIIGSRGIEYGGTYEDDLDTFIGICFMLDLQFIDPEPEQLVAPAVDGDAQKAMHEVICNLIRSTEDNNGHYPVGQFASAQSCAAIHARILATETEKLRAAIAAIQDAAENAYNGKYDRSVMGTIAHISDLASQALTPADPHNT